MIAARKCDRCGRVTGRPALVIEFTKSLTFPGTFFTRDYDLCKKCAKDFRSFMKQTANEESEVDNQCQETL